MDTRLTTQPISSPCCSPAGSAQRDDRSEVNIPRHEMVTTKSLWSRSTTESRQVAADQLKELILSGELADGVIYKVNGSVVIVNCPDLETLSGNISITGTLILENCPNLKSLSANLSVGGEFYVFNCPCLEDLTGSIYVDEALFMFGARGLVDVTGDVFVGAWIDMRHCISLRNITGTVHVNGDLNLYRCLSLKDLSGKITVNGSLNLGLCHYLTNLSGTISVGDRIALDHCSRLSCLPDWITSLGHSSTGDIRTIDLQFTGLSPALIDQIRSTAAPGMKFLFAKASEMTVNHFQEAGRAFAFWREQASSTREIPNLDLDWPDERSLLNFLKRLTRTDDFKNELSRPVLAQQVMGLLSALIDDQLRQKALSCIALADEDEDNDGVNLALNELETLALSRSTESLALDRL